MLHPQIVVFERESRLGPLLRDLAAQQRWALREPRQRTLCWEHLEQATTTVLVIRVERPADAELALLGQAARECPQVALVAVGGADDADTLAGLCWDLGADYALFPPLSRDLLPEVVRGLMERRLKKQSPPATAGGLEEF